MVKPSARKHVFNYLKEKYQACRRAICEVVHLGRSTTYRISTKNDKLLEEKLKELAEKYPTRGFDWYYGHMRAEGLQWNRKRVLRVYRKLGLVKRRKIKKRINRPYTEGLSQPITPNVSWSMDFMNDALEDGRRIRVLNVIDDYNRECLTIRCGISMPSERVTRILDEVIETRGIPMRIRTDNGPEFISHHYKMWCQERGIVAKCIISSKVYH